MLDIRILLDSDKEELLAFAKDRLAEQSGNPIESELAAWTARWRGEALDHYLKQGWSFGAFENGRLRGFVLAQPYLFHRGLTQTLWVEWLDGENPETAGRLLETVHQWARDKHFQCVLLEPTELIRSVLKGWPKPTHPAEPQLELRSARF